MVNKPYNNSDYNGDKSQEDKNQENEENNEKIKEEVNEDNNEEFYQEHILDKVYIFEDENWYSWKLISREKRNKIFDNVEKIIQDSIERQKLRYSEIMDIDRD